MLQVLQPIADLLLRRGITAHEFSRWANTAFVLAAARQLSAQGVEPSYSRISALTGIHRHAVSEILSTSTSHQPSDLVMKEYQRNRLARVLGGWFEDPVFTTEEGQPRILPLEGDSPSFSELVRKYSGDIYPAIILDELEKVGAVQRIENALVEATSRRYTSGGADEASFRHADLVATDVLRTLEHNTRTSSTSRLYEDAAVSNCLPINALPRLSRLLEHRATTFLDDLDGWLTNMEPIEVSEATRPPCVRAGVRVVMVVEPDPASLETDAKK